MPVTLRCDCGYETQLADEEAQETTWCPRCRKVLVQPRDVTAQRAFTRGARPPAAAGGTGSAVGARIAGAIAFAVILAVSRGACTDSTRYDSPNYDLRDFQVPPVQFEQPQLPEIPVPDNPAGPGFLPQPGDRNPFFPPDRNPLLPRDKDDLPGGDQPGPRPDDP
jgi:hypothetical protein